MSAPYPNATIYAHWSMTAAQMEQACHEHNLEPHRDDRGRFELAPKDAPVQPMQRIEPTEPEAA